MLGSYIHTNKTTTKRRSANKEQKASQIVHCLFTEVAFHRHGLSPNKHKKSLISNAPFPEKAAFHLFTEPALGVPNLESTIE